MTNPTLVIGSKNLSSWSLRPWLAMKQAGVSFQEIVIRLYQPSTKSDILKYSPNGKVPCLIDGNTKIWDSLAICEYIAESHPGLWPENRKERAYARAISNEMHTGFVNLRQNMPMNVSGEGLPARRDAAVEADIRRILEIWRDCREKFSAGGPFLFGKFSIADAMFAPVVTRFRTYGVQLDPLPAAYAKTILALPAMREWADAAKKEI